MWLSIFHQFHYIHYYRFVSLQLLYPALLPFLYAFGAFMMCVYVKTRAPAAIIKFVSMVWWSTLPELIRWCDNQFPIVFCFPCTIRSLSLSLSIIYTHRSNAFIELEWPCRRFSHEKVLRRTLMPRRRLVTTIHNAIVILLQTALWYEWNWLHKFIVKIVNGEIITRRSDGGNGDDGRGESIFDWWTRQIQQHIDSFQFIGIDILCGNGNGTI